MQKSSQSYCGCTNDANRINHSLYLVPENLNEQLAVGMRVEVPFCTAVIGNVHGFQF